MPIETRPTPPPAPDVLVVRQLRQHRQQRRQIALGHADQILPRLRRLVRRFRQRQPVRAERQRASAPDRRKPSADPDRHARTPDPAPPAARDRAAARSAEIRSLSAPVGSPSPSSTRPQRRNGRPARSASPITRPSACAGGIVPPSRARRCRAAASHGSHRTWPGRTSSQIAISASATASATVSAHRIRQIARHHHRPPGIVAQQ